MSPPPLPSSSSSLSLSQRKRGTHTQSNTDSSSSQDVVVEGNSGKQQTASETEANQVLSPDGGRLNNSDHRRSRHDSISSQEIDEGGKREGSDLTERSESRLSSYRRESKDSARFSKTFQREKSTTHPDPFSCPASKFSHYHSMRRASDDKSLRSVGGREPRKRRASSPAQSSTPLAKKPRTERGSVDDRKGNIFSRLGPTSFTRKRERNATSESPSPDPRRHHSSSRQDSSQPSSEKSQSPTSSQQHSSPGRSSSSRATSSRQSARGDEMKREGSTSPRRPHRKSSRGESERERERSTERRRSVRESCRTREEKEREGKKREKREEGGEKERGSAKQSTRLSDINSDSDRGGEKFGQYRINIEPIESDEEGDNRNHGNSEREESGIVDISFDDTETTANEEEVTAVVSARGTDGDPQREADVGRERKKKGDEDSCQPPSQGQKVREGEAKKVEEVIGGSKEKSSAATHSAEREKIETQSSHLAVETVVDSKTVAAAEEEEEIEEAPPTTAPPTSRDYTERDVTPPLEVLQSMQHSFQSPFYSTIPFPSSLTSFHPHLFAGHAPHLGGVGPHPTTTLSFSVGFPREGVAGGVVTSPGVWPVHMTSPAHWQQLWLENQRALGGGGPAPIISNDGSVADTTGPLTVATATPNVEPRLQSTLPPAAPTEEENIQPPASEETDTNQKKVEEVVPSPHKTTDNKLSTPTVSHCNVATSTVTDTLTQATQTTATEEGGGNSILLAPPTPDDRPGKLSLSSLMMSSQPGRRRKMDTECRLQYREMMGEFRRRASLLALSTKMMIRYIVLYISLVHRHNTLSPSPSPSPSLSFSLSLPLPLPL